MADFMVIARFRPGTDMAAVMAVVAEERTQVEVLKAAGRIGSVHLALARGTVFIETFADDQAGAEATIATLPMSAWWDLDVYALGAPATTASA